jgi:hypothetical protein
MPTALSCPPVEFRFEHGSEIEPELVLEFDDRLLAVDRERIRIGSGAMCEIRLPRGPVLHSVIRSEAGAVWIEAEEDSTDLTVNWRTCRRLALRDGDVITVAGCDISVLSRPAGTIDDDAATTTGDISQLTAEELCDRILAEQSAVDEFESSRLNGWQRLKAAIKAVAVADRFHAEALDNSPAAGFSDDCERLLDQIREMSEMMSGRTQELDACESELLAATSLLQETQDRVSRQIEELLNQIGDVPRTTELRVSA